MSEPTDPTTAASMAAAERNAQGSYPQTSGDLDPAQQTPTTDPELDQAMQSVAGVEAYLTADVDDTERLRRADAVEQAEAGRDGEGRKGVADAIAVARS